MRIKDIKIGTQLTIILSVILIFLVIIGALSRYQSDQIASRTEMLYQHPMQVRRALAELKTDILQIRLEFKHYLLSQDKELRSNSLQARAEYISGVEKQFEILYDRFLGPVADIDSAKNSFIRLIALEEEVFQNPPQNEITAILAISDKPGKIGIEFDKLFYYIGKIDHYAMDKGDQFYSDSTLLKQSLTRQLAVTIITIFLLTLLLLFYLRRLITAPLYELAEATQRFSEGKYDVRSLNISNNEIGQLSGSFNSMAEVVQDQLILGEKSARLSAVMLSEDDPSRFCHNLLDTLLDLTGGQTGAVYFLNEEKTEFTRFESLGMDREGCKPFSAVNFEGEFGKALSGKKLHHITTIPEDTRFTFSTVTGKFKPREIITLPILSGDIVSAVISIATIKNFDKKALELINEIEATLTARLNGILAYIKEIEFSDRLEHQNLELESQKSELFSLANELKEQNVELELQKKELDQSNRLKTTFLSNVSHELRTPLNSVIALSGVLSRRLAGKMPEEEHGYLSIIERNGKNLLALINDILDISRIESGREDVDIKSFNISTLAREIKDTLDVSANLKNIALINSVNDDLPLLTSDYEKCRHIILNIAANAVKFTEQGSVEINASLNDDNLEITVTDTGIGISPEVLPYVFDEFRQADGSTARKYGGTGLGLAIAKKYSNMLGGHITVESTLGKGTCFTLSLPLRLTPAMFDIHRTLIYEDFAIPVKSDAKGKTLLLVEDNEAVIIQMKDILETEGYNIISARNGNEALEIIRRVTIPDAMILDLMMPEVDDFEVLKSIRGNERTQSLPVLILTAKIVTKEELSFLKSNNVAQLIRKGDINKEQLLSAIARITASKKKAYVPDKIERLFKPVSGQPVILIVEDNPDNMTTIKSLIPPQVKIIEAEDGLKGVEMAMIHSPHLIFMDIALPGINGIEALKEIRREERLRDVPVIAVTASALKEDMERLIEIGFDGYFSKPIDINLFQLTLNKFLNYQPL